MVRIKIQGENISEILNMFAENINQLFIVEGSALVAQPYKSLVPVKCFESRDSSLLLITLNYILSYF